VNLSSDDIKRCCARAYQHDVVALILGDSYHPGGLELTRRLAQTLGLHPGERVLDIASGPGTTALLLASEFGVSVDGLDLGADTIAAAKARAADRGLADQVRFYVADGERLPIANASVDAVICECALCTFPDKERGALEMARVLRRGGRVGITDVTLDRVRLAPELASLAGWVACLADARRVADYRQLLESAGLRVTLTQPHDDALAKMIETIDARLTALAMIKPPALQGIDIDDVRDKVALAATAVREGTAGYSLIVARLSP
jgi:ubiquinone/menaquinone biosynthesis C-methylase UbiE